MTNNNAQQFTEDNKPKWYDKLIGAVGAIGGAVGAASGFKMPTFGAPKTNDNGLI
jgi:hypothetical protein